MANPMSLRRLLLFRHDFAAKRHGVRDNGDAPLRVWEDNLLEGCANAIVHFGIFNGRFDHRDVNHFAERINRRLHRDCAFQLALFVRAQRVTSIERLQVVIDRFLNLRVRQRPDKRLRVRARCRAVHRRSTARRRCRGGRWRGRTRGRCGRCGRSVRCGCCRRCGRRRRSGRICDARRRIWLFGGRFRTATDTQQGRYAKTNQHATGQMHGVSRRQIGRCVHGEKRSSCCIMPRVRGQTGRSRSRVHRRTRTRSPWSSC